MTSNTNYLTESKLGEYLRNKYGEKVTPQFRLPNRTRVDYLLNAVPFENRNHQSTDIIVEFDGYYHYQQRKTITRDLRNQEYLIKEGYHVIHIPYFIQTEFAFSFYFNTTDLKEFCGDQLVEFPLGFIDKSCLRPIDFSVDGWNRFIYETRAYPKHIQDEIRNTMSDLENMIFEDLFKIYGESTRKLYDSLNWI